MPMEAILFVVFVGLVVINVPIGVALGLSGIASLLLGDMPTPPLVVAQRMFTSVDSFPFMAIPFFMIAGGFMETGGMSRRLVEFAKSLVGTIPGGLGIITVIASAFFAALSGSNPATVAAIGSIMIPAMVKAGYPLDVAAALAAAAGTLGVIIPPSIPMVTYGVVTNSSIGDLFVAGIVPGAMIAVSLVCIVFWLAKKYDLRGGEPTSLKKILVSGKDALLALMMPIIILGGIYGGVFTPTEAAAVATVYALIVGMFVFREITLADLRNVIMKAAVSSAVVLAGIVASTVILPPSHRHAMAILP